MSAMSSRRSGFPVMSDGAGMRTRLVYGALGVASLVIGVVGAFFPLLPTVPFLILAAFCFSRSNPAWEKRLLDHPRYGPHILRWRERRAIGSRAKVLAVAMLAASAAGGLIALQMPWALLPAAVALVSGAWIVSRPSD